MTTPDILELTAIVTRARGRFADNPDTSNRDSLETMIARELAEAGYARAQIAGGVRERIASAAIDILDNRIGGITDMRDATEAGYEIADAVLSPQAQAGETLSGQIAAVYGSLDAEDCALVDREWAKQRGYILPADGTRTIAQPPANPNAAECWSIVEQLRAPEGAEVILLCDNPDFNGQPNNAIEICDDWTQWTQRRFTGETMLDCLRAALAAKGDVDKAVGDFASMVRKGPPMTSTDSIIDIPEGVYFSAEANNFYHVETKRGCGSDFYRIWKDYWRAFPQSEAAALSSTPQAGPMVPWELKCQRKVCAAPECDCPAVSSTKPETE